MTIGEYLKSQGIDFKELPEDIRRQWLLECALDGMRLIKQQRGQTGLKCNITDRNSILVPFTGLG